MKRITIAPLDGSAANLLFLATGLFLVGGVLVQIGYGGHSDTAGNAGIGVFLVGLLLSVGADRAMKRTTPQSRSQTDKRATVAIMAVAVLLVAVSATLEFAVGTSLLGIALLLFAGGWLLLSISDRVTVRDPESQQQ